MIRTRRIQAFSPHSVLTEPRSAFPKAHPTT